MPWNSLGPLSSASFLALVVLAVAFIIVTLVALRSGESFDLRCGPFRLRTSRDSTPFHCNCTEPDDETGSP